ncbi:MAG: DUF2029 domain-containing protein [Phycisphaera sp.]|nr:DUF2029 domain-containing protein [Phycisphaera sp.]
MYPPTTFVVMGPVAWLGWSLSKTVWVGVNVLLFGGAVFYLLRRTPLGTHTATACVFIALALAWAPIHANISQGQLGILAAVTGGVGLLMAERKKWFLPGVLVGISIAVKPQVGLLLLPGLALLRNWRALGFACGVIGLITVIGVLRLEATTPGWVDQLRANLDLFRNGQFGSATRSAPYRMQMLNLQYPLLQLVDAQRVIDPLVKGLTAVLAGVVAVSAWRRPTAGHTLLLCSALLSLMLMGVYHRVYDAAALLFPLAWALLPDQRTLKLRIWACAFLTAFLTPGGPMLTVVAQRGWIPAFVTGSVLWETVILPYQAWALFGLTVTLVVAWVTRHTPINSDNPSPMPA